MNRPLEPTKTTPKPPSQLLGGRGGFLYNGSCKIIRSDNKRLTSDQQEINKNLIYKERGSGYDGKKKDD